MGLMPMLGLMPMPERDLQFISVSNKNDTEDLLATKNS